MRGEPDVNGVDFAAAAGCRFCFKENTRKFSTRRVNVDILAFPIS
jgi:hypothetical protein